MLDQLFIKRLFIDHTFQASNLRVERNFKSLLIKVIKNLDDEKIKKILSFISKNFGGSHNVVVKTWGDWTHFVLNLGLLISVFTLNPYCITASNNKRGLKDLNDPTWSLWKSDLDMWSFIKGWFYFELLRKW